MLDRIAPPAGVFRIVDALQNANKDFDLLLLPNAGYSYYGSPCLGLSGQAPTSDWTLLRNLSLLPIFDELGA